MGAKSWAAAGLALILALGGCASSSGVRPPADIAAPPAPPPPPPPPSGAPAVLGALLGAVAGAALPSPRAMALFGAETTAQYPDAPENPVRQVAADPVSTFSIDVDTASYAVVRRFLNDGALPPKDAVRVEELINYFDYDYPLPASRARPFEPSVTLAPSPWGEGRTLLHVALQGYDVRPAERPPLNLVLLIDVSGSMQGKDRLPLAKRAFAMLVDQLGPRDRVGVVVYAGAAGVVLEPTSGDQRSKILGALEGLEAGGSTAGGAGLAAAYALAERNYAEGAVNRVILASDGDFNVGVTDEGSLEDFVARKRKSGIYLTYLGFGDTNYNDALAQALTQAGNGIAAYIDTLAEAQKVLHDQMQSALLPIADDVKIQVEFNPARVAEYRLIGYETRQLRREDFANDQVDAGEIGAGAAVTAIYELTPPGGRTLIEPLRYQAGPSPAAAARGGEIAFLRVRYKPPGAAESQLIERAITDRDAAPSLAQAPEAARFATAVAGFGQLLRQDPRLDRDYGYAEVLALAQSARGADPFGWRAEFVRLVRAAETARAGDLGP